VQQISKITYVKWVTNRHVITNSMHIGHTRYTGTLLNIKIQYAHVFISPAFYKNKIKNVYGNTSMVTYFFSAYTK